MFVFSISVFVIRVPAHPAMLWSPASVCVANRGKYLCDPGFDVVLWQNRSPGSVNLDNLNFHCMYFPVCQHHNSNLFILLADLDQFYFGTANDNPGVDSGLNIGISFIKYPLNVNGFQEIFSELNTVNVSYSAVYSNSNVFLVELSFCLIKYV